jgi:hypothetical protein
VIARVQTDPIPAPGDLRNVTQVIDIEGIAFRELGDYDFHISVQGVPIGWTTITIDRLPQ